MYTLSAREIPENSDYEVIVIGGGPAGCAAAAAAARNGAKTLLIESTYVLGGMGTAGLVPAWCPFSDKEKIIYRGIAEEVFNATKAQMPFLSPGALDWVAIDPEVLKRVYDDLVTGAGADILFGASLCGADREGSDIKALIISSKAGLSAYRAKIYIDCTGDADAAFFAGAEFQTDNTGSVQPSTLCFSMSGVNIEAFEHDPKNGLCVGGLHPHNKNSIIYRIAEDDRYPDITDEHLCNTYLGSDVIGFNAGHLFGVDNTDPKSVTNAIIRGRKMALQFKAALADYFPEAFADAHLSSTAQLMGIRESRRILGDYTITADDYIKRADFPDEISRNCYYIDMHMSPEDTEKMGGSEARKLSEARYGKGESHGVPYRIMLPKGIGNLLVAGRSVSCDRRMQASLRVMPNCLTTGQAAGTAAVLALSEDMNVHNVNTDELRLVLKEQGAYFK